MTGAAAASDLMGPAPNSHPCSQASGPAKGSLGLKSPSLRQGHLDGYSQLLVHPVSCWPMGRLASGGHQVSLHAGKDVCGACARREDGGGTCAPVTVPRNLTVACVWVCTRQMATSARQRRSWLTGGQSCDFGFTCLSVCDRDKVGGGPATVAVSRTLQGGQQWPPWLSGNCRKRRAQVQVC
ncbi:hypothetical protein TREES_T100020906 [Tupaia chinensis]|uniref:Uncharacterized protein n=1 Tax=Tupaia chinensis TaxID=246437 RepID=L9JHU0_TUPCH|nr:hypothetical protein TREES_T100020906 [Tupaia chinensis]